MKITWTQKQKPQSRQVKQKMTSKMADLKPITIITLNINGVNNIIKRSDCQDGLKKVGLCL